MSSRTAHLPAGLRWNDFQKYYRGHPNGATADRWQEYQALHAKGGAGQAAAVKVEQEAKAEPPVWRAPRPITPTERNVTDVADRLWERKRAGKEWARPDAEQKRQRGIGRVVLDSWGVAWRADTGSMAPQPAYVQRPALRPAGTLMGGSRGGATHYNAAGEPVAFGVGIERPLLCKSCGSRWGNRKLRCDCGAVNEWDRASTAGAQVAQVSHAVATAQAAAAAATAAANEAANETAAAAVIAGAAEQEQRKLLAAGSASGATAPVPVAAALAAAAAAGDVAATETPSTAEPAAAPGTATGGSGSGTSNFRGVNWDKQNNKWKSQIGHGKKNLSLGLFTEEKMAARAFDYAARILDGHMRRCNLPTIEGDVVVAPGAQNYLRAFEQGGAAAVAHLQPPDNSSR